MPEAGEIWIHDPLADTVHVQSGVVDTVNVRRVPAAGIDPGTPVKTGWHFTGLEAVASESVLLPQPPATAAAATTL